MPPLSDNLRGAGFMLLSMAGFVINDTLVKLASDEIGLFQLIFVRGLMATVLIALLAGWHGALRSRIGRRDGKVLGLRVVGELSATCLFLLALVNLPLANVTAILQSGPLAITLAAALFLGEPVGWRRTAAILVGFLGVLAIVRPGAESFTLYSLAAVASVGFVVLRDLSTRQFSPGMPSLLVVLTTSVAVTLLGGAVSAFLPWEQVSGRVLVLLAAASVAVTIGYFFGVKAMRVGEVAVVTPFRYSVLLWAILLGYAVWGDLPDAMTLVGAGLIVASSLYSFHRERRIGRPEQAAGTALRGVPGKAAARAAPQRKA